MDHPAAMQAKIVPQIMQPDENRYGQAADGVRDQITFSIATHLLAVMSFPSKAQAALGRRLFSSRDYDARQGW